jgi:hypothetical protein
VQHHAEAVDVEAGEPGVVDALTGEHLGRGEGGRVGARRLEGGEPVDARVAADAEVDDHDASVVAEQDVAGLEVAVHDALRVAERGGGGDGAADEQRERVAVVWGGAERVGVGVPSVVEAALQVAAGDELGGDPPGRGVGVAALVRSEVRVRAGAERAQQVALGEEAGAVGRLPLDLGAQHLHRGDVARVGLVHAAPGDAEGTLAGLFDGDPRTEAGEGWLGHDSSYSVEPSASALVVNGGVRRGDHDMDVVVR